MSTYVRSPMFFTDTMLCKSQYRCLNSTICLNKKYLCDSHRHCPYGDDERQCHFKYVVLRIFLSCLNANKKKQFKFKKYVTRQFTWNIKL